jgi:hypothetical protein
MVMIPTRFLSGIIVLPEIVYPSPSSRSSCNDATGSSSSVTTSLLVVNKQVSFFSIVIPSAETMTGALFCDNDLTVTFRYLVSEEVVPSDICTGMVRTPVNVLAGIIVFELTV